MLLPVSLQDNKHRLMMHLLPKVVAAQGVYQSSVVDVQCLT